MNTKLKTIIGQYFKDHDDYFEAKNAFIEDVNDILTSNDAGDAGVICKNRVNELVIELSSMLEVE
jgi:hypothetical protein